jgi:hypothetical protein
MTAFRRTTAPTFDRAVLHALTAGAVLFAISAADEPADSVRFAIALAGLQFSTTSTIDQVYPE